jgi:hypothetical protein
VALSVLFLGAAVLWIGSIHGFLSSNNPVPADALVVECWLPDYALREAISEFRRGGYRWMITSGYGLPEYMRASAHRTGSEVAAATLAAMGLETNCIVAVSAPKVARDRTFTAALAVRAWLGSTNTGVHALNVYSLGPHSRRSWLLYRKALGNRVRVGVISCPIDDYDAKRWWATSNGFREVLAETIAYLYARILFQGGNYEL